MTAGPPPIYKLIEAVADAPKEALAWATSILAAIAVLIGLLISFIEVVTFLSNPPALRAISGTVVMSEVRRTSGTRGRSGDVWLFIRIDAPSPDGSLFRKQSVDEGFEELRAAADVGRKMTFFTYDQDCRFACDVVSASADGVALFDEGMTDDRDRAWRLAGYIAAVSAFLIFAFWAFLRKRRAL